ncbi:hypothetical protein [Endozoicomonas sp. ISHI1]|uniref:hypothetical protein n=1 Tax=Endozoicomonas sp. ISHI1 TaxID=2825882 RepID=UPI0021479C36|nr:hypothetical protein [Endozoicomonas sp. ISHI1]
MKHSLSLFIITFVTILCSESSPALPTTSPSLRPTFNDTHHQTTASAGDLKLFELCSGNIEHPDLLTTEAMKQAAVKALEQVSATSKQLIDRCVIKTPLRDSYLDEEIAEFNANKSWEDTTSTAFLLVGVGMKSETIIAEENCALKKPVIAGQKEGQLSVLPSNWLEQFQIKKTLHLKTGQMLIGVPLDSSNGSFADDYFAAVQRKIEPTHHCNPSHLYEGYYRKSTTYKGELIHFSGAGILITGLTTLPALHNTFGAYLRMKDYCWRADEEKYFHITSHEAHSEMLKGELDLKSLEVPHKGYMLNIFGNELFQILQPAVSISLADESEDVDSRMFSGRTLVGFSNNKVYSCYTGQVEKALNIDIAYQDASPQPEFIRALEFKNNHILGNAPQAMSLVLPEHVKADISNNQFVTTKVSARSSRGICLAGPVQSRKNWQFPLIANLSGNLIKGYRTALSLAGYQKLVLNSNQLLGDRVSIGRHGNLTLPVTLAGDKNNQFKAGNDHPCYQLEHTHIIGGFIFSDATTTCPSSFTPPTMYTSLYPQTFSSVKSSDSVTTPVVHSQTEKPSTRKRLTSSQRLVTGIRQVFSNATEASYLESLDDKVSDSSTSLNVWQTSLVVVGGLAIVPTAIVLGYFRYKMKLYLLTPPTEWYRLRSQDDL